MATNYWLGKAPAVAQVTRITVVQSPGVGETYSLSVNNEAVAEYTSNSGESVASVAAELVSAWNASTSPYATGITATDNSDGTLDLTVDAAGIGEPFTVTASVDLSGGGDLTQSDTTASAGPNHYDTAGNWSLNHVPQAGEDVVLINSAIGILWGLEQSGVAINSFRQEQTFTGPIGLLGGSFRLAGSANATRTEYRPTYLELDAATVDLGIHTGAGAPTGSQLVKIDNKRSGASTTVVHNTHRQAQETGKTAVQLLTAHASANVYVRKAPGGVGVGIGSPGETPTLNALEFTTESGSDVLVTGDGTTLASYKQKNGNAIIQATGEVTSMEVDDGELEMLGDFDALALTANGGVTYPNNVSSDTGVELGTVTLEGGTVDWSRSNVPRGVGKLVPNRGTYVLDDDVVSVVSNSLPSGLRTVRVSQ